MRFVAGVPRYPRFELAAKVFDCNVNSNDNIDNKKCNKKLDVRLTANWPRKTLKVVRHSFPQSEAIHTQIALKMKNEYFLTKFCRKLTVYMP